VGTNTFRGFYKVDKDKSGAGEAFKGYFISNKDNILYKLMKVESTQDLSNLENDIRNDIKGRLKNIRQEMLTPYNKIRKPLDLYFEHLVSMAKEIDTKRIHLINYLSLPLDSQMFMQPDVFSDRDLQIYRVSRDSTYKDVFTEEAYDGLQKIVRKKAGLLTKEICKTFYPIYFDLLWNNRYKNWGLNLFETNP